MARNLVVLNKVVLFIFFVTLNQGCLNSLPKDLPPARTPDYVARSFYRLGDLTQRSTEPWVQIGATDLELPQMSSGDSPTDEREYSFDIWAVHPLINKPISELFGNEFRVDVVGVPASITPVRYLEDNPTTSGQVVKPVERNGNAVRVKVKSKDLTQSFSVIAWFPREYQDFEAERQRRLTALRQEASKKIINGKENPFQNVEREKLEEMESLATQPNPWGAVRVVRVFNGDLHTSIIMLSNAEITNAFGKNFAKCFHVGRVRFQNQHPDKKLIINTTSLRARTLFYRAANEEMAKVFLLKDDDSLSKAALAYLLKQPWDLQTESQTTSSGITPEDVYELIEKVIAGLRNAQTTDTAMVGLANSSVDSQKEEQNRIIQRTKVIYKEETARNPEPESDGLKKSFFIELQENSSFPVHQFTSHSHFRSTPSGRTLHHHQTYTGRRFLPPVVTTGRTTIGR